MYVCVIGTGYVGLVTGTVFADLGNDVACADVDEKKIQRLSAGEPVIYEPGLEEMLQRNLEDGRLTFTTDIDEAVRRAQVVFIAVGTPPKDNGETDLSQVEAAALSIARALNSYKVIVNKSTVPVGTGDFVRQIIERNRRRQVEFDVVSNPEFLREGSAIADTLEPDRIVIGAPSQQVALWLLELYAPLERPMLITDVESAELIKYASNAFLAMKISFVNQIADICEAAGADVTQVAKGMGFDKRIGPAFLQAGLGFGGSCFPKDTLSIIQSAKRYGLSADLFEAILRVNKERIPRFLERIQQKLGSVAKKRIAVLGLAFKPNTDDLRDAKSLEILQWLLDQGAEVAAYDPVAMERAKELFPTVRYAQSAYEAADGADAAIVVTEWNEFKLLNLDKLRAAMRQPFLFDGRNIYPPERVRKAGFEYVSIGR
ncbi:MAG: UDP-glucose/GDP-mannose dehydrogenase family protein [Candidatus Sumerlaeota bacterium]|nr:UDP-glucose/GDP-mannose dehydrogenase family protein [Candidatus Sumerlaeota bacterium]